MVEGDGRNWFVLEGKTERLHLIHFQTLYADTPLSMCSGKVSEDTKGWRVLERVVNYRDTSSVELRTTPGAGDCGVKLLDEYRQQ